MKVEELNTLIEQLCAGAISEHAVAQRIEEVLDLYFNRNPADLLADDCNTSSLLKGVGPEIEVSVIKLKPASRYLGVTVNATYPSVAKSEPAMVTRWVQIDRDGAGISVMRSAA